MSFVDVDLGAVDVNPVRTAFVREGQVLLVKTLEAARKFRETFPGEVQSTSLSDPRIAASLLVPFLGFVTAARVTDARKAAQEAADNIYASTEASVVRLLTVGTDGVFAWEKNPKLLTTPLDFLRGEMDELRRAAANSQAIDGLTKTLELLGQVASTLAKGVTEATVGAVRVAAEEIANQINKTSGGGLVVIGIAAAALLAAFVLLDD